MTMTKGEAIGFLEKCRYWFMPYTSEEDTWNEALDMAIEALQIDLVRCKDCKHRETDDCPMYWTEWAIFEYYDGHADNNEIIHDYTTDNGYCNYGEREEP